MFKSACSFAQGLGALVLCAVAPVVFAQAPVVAGDSYGVNVNGMLSIAAPGVLGNDSGFNAVTHRLETYDRISRFGASVSLGSDGSLTYDPPAGFRGVDNFSYTVRNANGATAAVVQVDVSGNTVWFVDDTAAAGGDGSITAPFNSFTQLNGSFGVGDVDSAGDTIFVYEGAYTVSFDVEAGQRLIGHSEGLDLVGTANDVSPAAAPVLTGDSFPIIELFGAGHVVRGFTINNTQGKAIQGNGVSGFTVANIDIASTATSSGAIEILSASGTNTFNDVDITGAVAASNPAIAIFNNAGIINFIGSSVSSFTGGYVLNVSGNSGTIMLDANSDLSASATRGLIISTQAATGQVNLAGVNLSGGAAGEPLVRLQSNNAASSVHFTEGLSASATTADTAALLSDGGRLTIAGTASTLSSSDGPALYLEAVELTQNATFASVSSNSSNARGISIADPVGNNDLIVTGTTTITAPTTEAIRVASSSTSGFALQMATLNSTAGTVGISVNNAAVAVTNNASTVVNNAGPALLCTSGTVNLALATLTSAGGNNAISANLCAGTVTAAGGTLNSTAGASNHVVNLINSSISLNYGGNIPKSSSGAAVNIDGLTSPGSATFGAVSATNASSGIAISNSARPVTFGTLLLGDGTNRFTTMPIQLSNNSGAVDLGVLNTYVNGVTALRINYANPSPGLVTTDAGSLLNVAGAAKALEVAHAGNQPLNLSFQDITNSGAGTHGIDINRASGALVVSGLVNLGAKTVAGVQISNSSLVTSLGEVDITGAADGVRLSNNTGSFTILGDGNFVSSHTNGAGGTFSNLTDNAFDLNTVSNFRATDVTVSGTGGHGVTGTGITGTTIFSNVDFSNIGNADNEHVFNLQEGAVAGAQVSGSLEINNSVIENFTEHGLYLENFTGALDFRFTDNVLRNNITTIACGGGNCNGNGILLRADGTARINAFILNSAFEQIDGIAVTANPEGNSGARMDLNLASSSFNAQAYGGPGHTNNGETAISLRNAQGNATLNFRLFSNDIRNYTGEFALGVVEIEGGDFTTTNGVVSDLYIYQAHIGDALSVLSDGANTAGSGTTDNDLILSFNNVRTPGGTAGSSFYFSGNGAISGSDANAQVSLTNSQFPSSPSTANRHTVDLTFDSGVANFNRGCFNVSGNQVAAGSSGLSAIDLYYISSTQVRLQGMSGTGDANAQARLNAANTLGNSASVGTLNNITSATCTTPTLPVGFPF